MEQVDTRCEKCIAIGFWHGWHTSQVHEGVEYLQCFHSPKFVEVRPEPVYRPLPLVDERWYEVDPLQRRQEESEKYGAAYVPPDRIY